MNNNTTQAENFRIKPWIWGGALWWYFDKEELTMKNQQKWVRYSSWKTSNWSLALSKEKFNTTMSWRMNWSHCQWWITWRYTSCYKVQTHQNAKFSSQVIKFQLSEENKQTSYEQEWEREIDIHTRTRRDKEQDTEYKDYQKGHHWKMFSSSNFPYSSSHHCQHSLAARKGGSHEKGQIKLQDSNFKLEICKSQWKSKRIAKKMVGLMLMWRFERAKVKLK